MQDGLKWVHSAATMESTVRLLRCRDPLKALSLFALCTVGCGGPTIPSHPTDADLPGEITSIARGVGLFSFQYAASPPNGRAIQFATFRGTDSPCDFFTGAGTPSVSFVKVATRQSNHGEYRVEPSIDYASSAPAAYVEWVDVEAGNAQSRARAVGGTVEYLDGPTDEVEWQIQDSARILVAIEFEKDPVVKTACRGGIARDASVPESHCSCERLSGSSFVCDAQVEDCCRNTTGELVHVDFEIRARRCAAACSATSPELLQHCRSLQQ